MKKIAFLLSSLVILNTLCTAAFCMEHKEDNNLEITCEDDDNSSHNNTTSFNFHKLTFGSFLKKNKPKKEPLHIVFDTNFLLQPNTLAAAKKLGFTGITQGICSSGFSEEKTIKELFGLIKNIKDTSESENTEVVVWKTNQVPPYMISWLKGKVPCLTMTELIKEEIKKKYTLTTYMNTVTDMAFEPASCCDVLSPCKEAFSLITDLQNQGHTVHVLGNWHSDVRKKMIETFAKQFKIINGTITVSGDLGHVKCSENSAIYETFCEKASIPTSKVCFVEMTDSQQAKGIMLKEEKPTIITAWPSQIPQLKEILKKKGFLTDK